MSIATSASAGNRTALLNALKHCAKDGKKANPHLKLSWFQDQVAIAFGYLNWSLLHKHLLEMSEGELDALIEKMKAHSKVGSYLNIKALNGGEGYDEESAKDEMREWVRGRYTRLIEFAFYDNESENGFAWPDVVLSNELQDEFSDRYPHEVIINVSAELEQDGPWGIEDYGNEEG
jgi:hypothetical protein